MRDESTESDDGRALIVAALVGAAIGAGIGLLASQALDDDDRITRLVRTTRRGVTRRVRRGSKAALALRSAAGGAIGDAIGDARDSVGGFASRARDAFEEALEREVKQLRRVARKQRRRLGL